MVNNSYTQDTSDICGLISGISNAKIFGNIGTMSTLIFKELQLPRDLASKALPNCSQSVVPRLLEGKQTGQAGRKARRKEGKKDSYAMLIIS